MADTIDVRDLTDEQVAALEALAEFYRRRRQGKKPRKIKAGKAKHREECTLAIRDSGVIGTLTREELYDDR